jgi:hypothetical protein
MVRQAAGLAFTATRTDESRSALQEAKKDESDFPRRESGDADRIFQEPWIFSAFALTFHFACFL